LQSEIEQQLQSVVEKYSREFPSLAISVAYKDANHDITAAYGKPQTINREVSTEDTFLYGSGTKPFTATAILRLIDQGKLKATDKVTSIVDPYLKAQGQPSLESFFGEAIAKATVLESVRMGTGIRDFEDDFTFDQWVLAPENSSKFWSNYPYDAMSWSTSPQNTKGGGPLYCEPGQCTAYSSTGFELAGLILAATLNPSGNWYDFDLATGLSDDRSGYPSMVFPPKGRTASKLSAYLTVPGQSTANTWPKTTIYEQDPSILGWTCGNMVAAPRDVAKFFYHLLDAEAAAADAKPLISDASRAEMTNVQTLTTGWNAGKLKYGAGLMALTYGSHTSKERIPVLGHEGDTYGFLSSQGYVPSLKGAYSVATNVDNSAPMEEMVSQMLQTISAALNGVSAAPVIV
jgi:CubicO group peptidase (beta-lactamase class C family)